MSAASSDASRPSPAARPAPAAAGSAPLFRERLLPSPGTWVVFVIGGAMFGVILVPLSTTIALVAGIIGIVVAVVLGVATAPVLSVDREGLIMGRARVEHDLLGEPEVLEGEDWARRMGVDFEPLAFHCTRGWIHSGVRVPLHDEDDPTSAWVASSRRPGDLALALRSARASR